jgi:UDP-glucose 4-epimerase
MLDHLQSQPAAPTRSVVVGSGGFVGGAILRELTGRGMSAVGLTRKDVDLLAPSGGEALARHLKAGDSVVFVSAIAPAKNVTQLMDNLRMAEAACQAFTAVMPGHLLYISSDAIYADDANPVTESSPAAPTTTHGMMHAARELMFKTAVTCPFAVLRPTLIYGAGDPHSGYGPNRFRRQAAKSEPISIFGEGEERRDHVLVDDVARLAALILLHKSRGALNAVTGVSTSFRDIADMVAAQFPGGKVASTPRPGPRPHLLHRFFDITGCLKAFPDFRYVRIADGIADVHKQTVGQS